MLDWLPRSFPSWTRRARPLTMFGLILAVIAVAATVFVLLPRVAGPTSLDPASTLEPASADPVRSCDAEALDAAFQALDEASGYRFHAHHEVSDRGETRTATVSGAYRGSKRMHATVTSATGGLPLCR